MKKKTFKRILCILMTAALLTGFSLGTHGPVGSAKSFDNVFWETRQADIFGQMVAIIAGASARVVFFKESENQGQYRPLCSLPEWCSS